jgi:hypothetical protein
MHGTIQVLALLGATRKAMISPDASIEDILQYFTVGADLSKRSPGLPNATDLGRLRRIVYQQRVKAHSI